MLLDTAGATGQGDTLFEMSTAGALLLFVAAQVVLGFVVNKPYVLLAPLAFAIGFGPAYDAYCTNDFTTECPDISAWFALGLMLGLYLCVPIALGALLRRLVHRRSLRSDRDLGSSTA